MFKVRNFRGTWFGLGVLWIMTMVILAGEPSLEAQSAPGPEGWILQFTDNFERKNLGKEWHSVSGSWGIKNGMLAIDREGTIVCTIEFPGDQRLEFDARSENPCDLTGLLS